MPYPLGHGAMCSIHVRDHNRAEYMSQFKELLAKQTSGTGQHGASSSLHFCVRTHWSKLPTCTHGLVAMTSAQHAEGPEFDPQWVYIVHEHCQSPCDGGGQGMAMLSQVRPNSCVPFQLAPLGFSVGLCHGGRGVGDRQCPPPFFPQLPQVKHASCE